MNRIYTVLLLLLPLAVQANNFDDILQSIEQKNVYLGASRLENEAEKANARMDASLSGIDAEFDYEFGMNGVPNKMDWTVSQSFDGATLTGQKSKLSKQVQNTSDLRYLSKRRSIRLAAQKLCIQVVYCNAMLNHLEHDLEDTKAMSEDYEKLFEKGEATIIEKNKAHQETVIYENRHHEIKTMRANALAKLKHMNGGEAVVINDSAFIHETLPEDFTTWLNENIDRHPELKLLEGEAEVSKKEVSVAKSEYMPGISIGYTGEKDGDDQYHGIALGLSLPSWGAGRNLKAKKLQAKAAEMVIEDNRKQLYIELENLYREALYYQETYKTGQQHVVGCHTGDYLQKMLDKGAITPLEFHMERQYFHYMYEYMLEAEMEFENRMAELSF